MASTKSINSLSWQHQLLHQLSLRPVCGYRPTSEPHTEPTALVALALRNHGRNAAAEQAADWLSMQQRSDGRVAVGSANDEPAWGTGLAMLAWMACGRRWQREVNRGVGYLLSVQGTVCDNTEKLVNHDTTIPGWSWIRGTHSWVEPTAMNLLALQAAGAGDHSRVMDGRRLLVDRLLPQGGCNYGNTLVLGQIIRPHVQPTGLAMLALANQVDIDGRIGASLDYLEEYLAGKAVTTASASYAMMALAAHKRSVNVSRIQPAVRETMRRHAAPAQLALALLASQGARSNLVRYAQEAAT